MAAANLKLFGLKSAAEFVAGHSQFTDSSTSIVIGCIYDGSIFSIAENKVERIFIGAAAE